MADPRFFTNAGPFSLGDIAKACQAEIASEYAPHMITDLAPLDGAGQGLLTFLENKSYRAQAATTKASACFIKATDAVLLPAGCAALVSRYPYWSYALAAHLFYPQDKQPSAYGSSSGQNIDPSARIHPSAIIGDNVTIGAGVVAEPMATIGSGCVIGAGSVIGPHVSLSHALLGERVKLYAGARIGQPGFGYAIDGKDGRHLAIPQLGRVLLHDEVEIGANTTVDRGAGPDTIIGAGTKIDNLCQIAHNVTIGKGCFMAGHVGISGSCKIGDFVMIGGQAGLAGHLTIGDKATILAKSGLMRDVAPGETVMGAPAIKARDFMKREAWLRRQISVKNNQHDEHDDD